MKLSEWAEQEGISYRTAWNWFNTNKLPVNAYQAPTGTIIVQETEKVNSNSTKNVIIYGRVSSSNKKEDLQNQILLCEQYCIAKGWNIEKSYKEIASGMNDNRKMLNKILENPPDKLVILHRDRLTRFGFNFIKSLLKHKNCELVVINENKSDEEDLMKDFIAIITSFCCRLYGARRGQAKALALKGEIVK
jgi:predicted site-specific integrase-resolvase